MDKYKHALHTRRKKQTFSVRLDAKGLIFAAARNINVSATVNDLFLAAMHEAGLPKENPCIEAKDVVGHDMQGNPLTKEMVE